MRLLGTIVRRGQRRPRRVHKPLLRRLDARAHSSDPTDSKSHITFADNDASDACAIWRAEARTNGGAYSSPHACPLRFTDARTNDGAYSSPCACPLRFTDALALAHDVRTDAHAHEDTRSVKPTNRRADAHAGERANTSADTCTNPPAVAVPNIRTHAGAVAQPRANYPKADERANKEPESVADGKPDGVAERVPQRRADRGSYSGPDDCSDSVAHTLPHPRLHPPYAPP